jgi:hypothetical protein
MKLLRSLAALLCLLPSVAWAGASLPPGVPIASAATGALVARLFADRFRDSINVLDEIGVGETADIGINRAVAKAAGRGGAKVIIPNIGYAYIISNKITLLSSVRIIGIGNPVLQLANGANTTVIEGQNYQSLTGTDSAFSGISNFGVSGLTVDGNSANNNAPAAKSGHGIAFVGRDFLIDTVKIQNTYRRGLASEYAAGGTFGASPYNGHIRALTINGTGEEGWKNDVSDLHAEDINVRATSLNSNAAVDAIALGPYGGIRGNNINVWSTGTGAASLPRYAISVAADGTTINGAHLEMGATANLFNSGNNVNIFGLNSYNLGSSAARSIIWTGGSGFLVGHVYPGASGGTAFTALQLGSATATTSANQNDINLHVYNAQAGLVDWTNSGGGNTVRIAHNLAAGGVMSIGTQKATDRFDAVGTGAGGDTRYGGSGVSSVQYGAGANASAQNAVAIGTNAIASSGCEAVGANNTCSNFGQFVSGTRAQGDANWGARVHAGGQVLTQGDNEIYELHWRGTLTSTTATKIYLDNSSQEAVIPVNTTWGINSLMLTCRLNGTGATLVREWKGSVSRGTGAAAFDGTPTPTDLITPASGWSVALTAGNSGIVSITVTGAANATCGANMRAQKVTS